MEICTYNFTKVFILMISIVNVFASLDTVIKISEVQHVSCLFLEFPVSLTMEFHSFSIFSIDVTILGVCVTVEYRKGKEPIAMAARYKAWVCGSSLAEIAGSNPTDCTYSYLL